MAHRAAFCETTRGARVRSFVKPAIFLDKDGTLVEDNPRGVDPAGIMLLRPGAYHALRLLSAAAMIQAATSLHVRETL